MSENVFALVIYGEDSKRILDALLEQPETIEDIARVAADKMVAMQGRLAALRGVVDAVSILDRPLPSAIATAIADPDLVDAAIAKNAANPIVAAIHQLKSRAEFGALRKQTIQKLLTAGARGINLAWLAVEIGDHASAVKLAIIDFDEHLAERLTDPSDPVIGAWLEFLVQAPEPVRRDFLNAFGDRKRALLSLLRPDQRARLFRTFDLRTLSRASSSGNLAIIREHLDGGGDPNAGDTRSGTVILHDAAYFKQPEIVRALLEARANPNARDRDGRGPLQLAIQFPPGGPIAMIVGGSFTVIDTPEARRDRAGQIAIVNMLLDAGADPNPPASNALLFSFPLSAAASAGDLELVKILLARGANPNAGCPLVDAVNGGHGDVVHALLEANANPNQRQQGGASALLRSVDAIDNVMYAERRVVEARKETFGIAHESLVRTRMRVITKFLLRAGADRSIADDRGDTPLESAKRTKDERLVQLLTPKTAELARATMLREIGDAHGAAKLLNEPTVHALGVVWSTIHAYAPNPGETARTYAERMIAWSREMLARHALSIGEETFTQIRDSAI